MSSALLTTEEFHPHIQALFDYADSVVTGQKPACLQERQACERFYADLERESEYRFDHALAIRAINFIELLPHVKGRWAAKKQRLVLEPFQKFIIGNIFGWINKQTGLRRFRRAYVKIARKNGKSPLAAGIGLYMLCADKEFAAEVYCGATTEKQAWEVFRPARLMCQKLHSLRRTFQVQVNARSIEAKNGARFEPLIGKPGDGSAPSCAIIDEYHEHKSADMYDTMLTGMVGREQPLLLVITTAGGDITSPCYEHERECERVLLGEACGGVDNDELFVMIFGIDNGDDWTTEEAIIKANPNYGVSVGIDIIKAAQKYAIQNPGKQNSFKTKHLNIWCWAKNAYFNAQKWQDLADTSLKLEDFKDEEAFVGLDLAKIYDLSCIVTVFRRMIGNEKHYYVFTKAYLPEETIQDANTPELYDKYTRWFIEGHLLPGGDAEMDLTVISNEVIQMQQDGYNVVEVPHDPHLGFLIAKELGEAGLTPVEMRQHGSYLGPGMREIEAAIAAGRIHHDGNPVMAWCIGNVLGKEYSNGGLMPDRENKLSKIDAAVGLIMAVARAMLGESNNLDDFLNNPVSA